MVTEYQFARINSSEHSYLFISEGPSGSALKLVSLVEIPDDKGVYNIAIVDVDPDTGTPYSDQRYTGNHEALKVNCVGEKKRVLYSSPSQSFESYLFQKI